MNTEYQTNRLILKLLTPDYLREVLSFQVRNKDFFEKYEPTRPDKFYTYSFQHALLKSEYNLALKLSSVRFYVFRKEDNHTIIGTVCLHDITRIAYSCCEIGYKFDHSFWHHGYALEAVEAAVQVAFRDLNLHRVFARVMPENEASIRLLKAAHFTEEGLERSSIQICGKWEDHMRLSLLDSEWKQHYSSINRYQ